MNIKGLKPKLAAVENFVSGKDTFVALPTGSIIVAILPLLFDLLLGKPVQTINYVATILCAHNV